MYLADRAQISPEHQRRSPVKSRSLQTEFRLLRDPLPLQVAIMMNMSDDGPGVPAYISQSYTVRMLPTISGSLVFVSVSVGYAPDDISAYRSDIVSFCFMITVCFELISMCLR